MTKITEIEKKIKVLEGGIFQRMMDEYISRKYSGTINPYGIQFGTNKAIIGVPDTYITHEDSTYSLIMYGTSGLAVEKLKTDLTDVLDKEKVAIDDKLIKRIILVSTADRVSVTDQNDLRSQAGNIDLEILTLRNIALGLSTQYPNLAKEYLDVKIDSDQIFSPEEFIGRYDNDQLMAPLGIPYVSVDTIMTDLIELIKENEAVLITGLPGVGKTRTLLETVQYFEKQDYETLVIKNNGQPLYEDIKTRISNRKKYLIIFDDINQTKDLKAILMFLQEQRPEVKIVGTARLYEIDAIRTLLKRFKKYKEQSMDRLSDKQIQDILSNFSYIQNEIIIDKIINISKGNPRIAVLTAKLAKNELNNVENITDLFKIHFSPLIEKNDLTNDDVRILFILAFFGKVNVVKNNNARTLLSFFNIKDEDCIDSCNRLVGFELVDSYLEILNIPDQVFQDYILQYVLFEKKIIKISDLIKMFYLTEPEKIIAILNTQFQIFADTNYVSYIESEVKKLWIDSEPELENYLLDKFYALHQTKALSIINKRMLSWETAPPLPKVDTDVFEKKDDREYISVPEIQVLAGFKGLIHMPEAIRLLSKILEKRPDYFRDVYLALNNYAPSYESNQNGFDDELSFIEEFWKGFGNKKIENKLIFINVVQKFMLISNTQIEPKNEKSVRIIRWEMPFTDRIKNIRSFIWKKIAELHKDIELKDTINEFLYNYSWHGEKGVNVDLMEFDFECILDSFDLHESKVDFLTYVTFRNLNRLFKTHIGSVDNYFQLLDEYQANRSLEILEILQCNNEWDYEKSTAILKPRIAVLNVEELTNLFNTVSLLEQIKYTKSEPFLSHTLNIIIESYDIENFDTLIQLYFQANSPYSLQVCAQLQNLNTQKRIIIWDQLKTNQNENTRIWYRYFFDTCTPELIDVDMVRAFENHLKVALNQKMHIPNIGTVMMFDDVNPGMLLEIGEKINELATIENQIASNFLIANVDSKVVVNKFSSNMDLLQELYLKSLRSNFFDYRGDLFFAILERNEFFSYKSVQFMLDEIGSLNHFETILDSIWAHENYEALIVEILELVGSRGSVFNGFEQVFSNNSDINVEKHKALIQSYIDKHKNNLQRLVVFFGMYINKLSNSEEKLYYWEYLLKVTTELHILKKIPLVPMSKYWSGSEVPVIDSEIDFMRALSELSILDSNDSFIDFKLKIYDDIEKQKMKRDSILTKEYLE